MHGHGEGIVLVQHLNFGEKKYIRKKMKFIGLSASLNYILLLIDTKNANCKKSRSRTTLNEFGLYSVSGFCV